ncbi:MAG: hypothetical protein U0U46_03280 [Saprospiraceae bacterium]
MTDTPLLQILRTLSPAALRAFDKYVHSPYLVTHADTVGLYDYLRPLLQHADPALLRKEKVAETLGHSATRLAHLSSYLLETLESFLALEDWLQQGHEQHLLTVAHLRRLRLDEPAAAMLRYARRRLEADPRRGGEYHRLLYQFQLESLQLSQQQGRARALPIQELSDAQDVAFICEKLRTGCLLSSHQAVAQQGYDKGLLDSVLRFLDGHAYLDIPIVAAYFHGYYAQLGHAGSDEHFRRLKAVLQAHAGRFSLGETHDLYLLAINFCIRRINQAEESYFRDVFELYQSGLQHGALLEDGVLSRWTYTNIALSAFRLREFDWVQQFLKDFAPLLPAGHREGAFHFNMARYHYHLGRHRESMQHLLRMDYDDVLHNLAAKTLLCIIYYELEEYDALDNQLDSLRAFIRRKKILGYHRANYSSFIHIMRQLSALPHRDTRALAHLRAQIEAAVNLPEREWFLRQIGQGTAA